MAGIRGNKGKGRNGMEWMGMKWLYCDGGHSKVLTGTVFTVPVQCSAQKLAPLAISWRKRVCGYMVHIYGNFSHQLRKISLLIPIIFMAELRSWWIMKKEIILLFTFFIHSLIFMSENFSAKIAEKAAFGGFVEHCTLFDHGSAFCPQMGAININKSPP